MLCSLLDYTKVLGKPREWNHNQKSYHDNFREQSISKVAGVKLMIDEFRHVPTHHFVSAKHIWLRRRDKIYHAISHIRAKKTGLYTHKAAQKYLKTHKEIPKLPITPNQIKREIQLLTEGDTLWMSIFKIYRIQPLIIWYEDIEKENQSQVDTIARILKFLNISKNLDRWPPKAKPKKQADAYTEEIYQRYLKSRHSPEVQ